MHIYRLVKTIIDRKLYRFYYKLPLHVYTIQLVKKYSRENFALTRCATIYIVYKSNHNFFSSTIHIVIGRFYYSLIISLKELDNRL